MFRATHQKGDLGQAFRAFDVEPVDLDAQIGLSYHVLFLGVELFASIDVFAASRASHVERGHEADGELAVLFPFETREFRRIEVGRVVFLSEKRHFKNHSLTGEKTILTYVENFSFGHFL